MGSGAAQDLEGYTPHIGESRQYWRDIILGVNDGLVSMFLLVAGVVGGGLNSSQVLLTAIAGAVAGAVSMAAGEYLATKSQDQVLEAELVLERTHIKDFRGAELEQLREMFTDMGLLADDVDTVVDAFDRSDEAILNAMKSLEFGVVDSEKRSPYMAMAISGVLFLAGSIPSVVPFAFGLRPTVGLAIASVLSLLSLFLVGVVKARVVDAGPIRSGLENLVIAGVGGVLAWYIGDRIGTAVL
ncbi:MAG TPA: VIT1/CCC1 transporter family protein [Acidimicrobiia bacterium]|nr:VIT1/CCC1 transporter family protein [Acidimicrobiia bacterium]